MKRILLVVLAVLCVCALSMPVLAQSQADSVRTETQVSADGSCRVTVYANVTYDEAVSSPVFPIPSDAKDILLDGSAATVYPAASSQMVSLKDVTRGVAGSFSFTVSYSLPTAVAATGDGLVLTLQLLSGFPYPITDLEMTVRLPGEITAQPVFTSAYYQGTAQDLLDVAVSGDTLTVEAVQQTKDHETLVMELPVDPSVFPKIEQTARVLGVLDLILIVTLLLALVYYFATMRPSLPRKPYRTVAPDGISPGDTAMWLAGCSRDLSMLVVTWARLGYIRIQVEDSGRVLLHKRMEMGNERSSYENRLYKNLFGKRRMIDGTGYHYAQLCRSVMKKAPPAKEVYRASSGSPLIFRGLCVLCGGISGIGIGAAFTANSVTLMLLIALLTSTLSLLLQSAGRSLLLRRGAPLWIGLTGGLVWLVMAACAGSLAGAVVMVTLQLFMGILLAFGGKRTELGQQALVQLMGLRRFMGRARKKELQQLLKANPGYFHELAPYALAMGRDKTFARRFGRLRLPECTYLICGNRRQMTAAEWAALLRATVDTLDARAKKLPLERLLGK